MFDISKRAAIEIEKRFAKTGENPCVRVASKGTGSGGPILNLVADDAHGSDVVYKAEGFDLVANKKLVEEMGGVKIAYAESHWGGGALTVSPLVSLRCGGCGDCRC